MASNPATPSALPGHVLQSSLNAPRPPSPGGINSDMDASGEEDVGDEDGDVAMTVVPPPAPVAPAAPTPAPFATGVPIQQPVATLSASEREEVAAKAKEEEERRLAVEKVLKRAEISKITRAFKTRLALATFKTERGWQDIKFDDIEPHVEQEAAKMKQAREYEIQQQQQQQQQQLLQQQQLRESQQQQHHQQQMQYSSVLPVDDGLMGPPLAAHSGKRPRGGSLANASTANTTMYDQYFPNGVENSSYASSPVGVAVNGDVYAAGYPQHSSYLPTASTSSLQPAVQLQHQGLHQSSHHQPQQQSQLHHAPQFTTSVIRNDSHRQKRRQTTASESLPNFVTGHASPPRRPLSAGPLHSPRTRNSATRSSIHRMPEIPNGASNGQPVSTADPNFSSFVDAASVLTGLARAPSDGSLMGQEDDHMRPQTPPRLDKGKAVANTENDTAGAAELMLFLAQSPSPARTRTAPSQGVSMGEGGMKGRRLFGGGDDEDRFGTGSNAGTGGRRSNDNGNVNGVSAASAYGSALTSSSAMMDTSSSSLFDYGNGIVPIRPTPTNGTLHSSATFDTSSSSAPKASAVSTPSRERQQQSGAWDSYINVSPSPQRTSASQSFSMPLTSLSPTSLPLGRPQAW